MRDGVSGRQVLSLGTVILLTPTLRLFPARTAELAGRLSWLTAGLAFLPLLGYAWFLARLEQARREGETLADYLARAGGRPALAVTAAWALLYAAFVLRSGADRFVGTVYPRASPPVFAEAMGALALWAALHSERALLRTARLVQPFLLLALGLLLLFACREARLDNLLPATLPEAPGLLRGTLVPLDLVAGVGLAMGFAVSGLPKRGGVFRALGLWTAAMCLLLTLLSVAVTGVLGAELTVRLSRPFFSLVRTLVFFRTVERLEALVVMLWIFPDFLITALFLRAAAQALRRLLGYDGALDGEGLGRGRWLILAAGLLAAALSFVLAPDAQKLERWSAQLIPALNLCYALVFLPAIYIIDRAKR